MSPSPYGDSCFSDDQIRAGDNYEQSSSPSPYGDSCFSDPWQKDPIHTVRSVSPSPYGDSCFSDEFTIIVSDNSGNFVSVPLRGFVFL